MLFNGQHFFFLPSEHVVVGFFFLFAFQFQGRLLFFQFVLFFLQLLFSSHFKIRVLPQHFVGLFFQMRGRHFLGVPGSCPSILQFQCLLFPFPGSMEVFLAFSFRGQSQFVLVIVESFLFQPLFVFLRVLYSQLTLQFLFGGDRFLLLSPFRQHSFAFHVPLIHGLHGRNGFLLLRAQDGLRFLLQLLLPFSSKNFVFIVFFPSFDFILFYFQFLLLVFTKHALLQQFCLLFLLVHVFRPHLFTFATNGLGGVSFFQPNPFNFLLPLFVSVLFSFVLFRDGVALNFLHQHLFDLGLLPCLCSGQSFLFQFQRGITTARGPVPFTTGLAGSIGVELGRATYQGRSAMVFVLACLFGLLNQFLSGFSDHVQRVLPSVFRMLPPTFLQPQRGTLLSKVRQRSWQQFGRQHTRGTARLTAAWCQRAFFGRRGVGRWVGREGGQLVDGQRCQKGHDFVLTTKDKRWFNGDRDG